MQKAQSSQPLTPQAGASPAKDGFWAKHKEGFKGIYEVKPDMVTWDPGSLRTALGPTGIDLAKKHPYNEELVQAVADQCLLDWYGIMQPGTTASPGVVDSQYKRAVMILDDLRLAGYEVLVRKNDG